MSLSNCCAVGPAELLPNLRHDLLACSERLTIIGPWIDDYFADQLVSRLEPQTAIRVLTRGKDEMDGDVWMRVAESVAILKARSRSTEHRTLSQLHAKCILIDTSIVYLGSFNWYRHSLEHSQEIAVRLPWRLVEGLIDLTERFWSSGLPEAAQVLEVGNQRHGEGLNYEVLDPLAAQVLKSNPKAFIVGKQRFSKGQK